MITKIYAVIDNKAEAFLPPFFVQTTGVAIRSFSDAIKNPESPLSKHPEDYALFELGSYNDANGIITPNKVPVHIANASEFKGPQLDGLSRSHGPLDPNNTSRN